MHHLAKTLLLLLLLCHVPGSWADDVDPAQVAIGERLFLETRFSQFFFAHAGGNPNATLAEGDPVTTSLAPCRSVRTTWRRWPRSCAR